MSVTVCTVCARGGSRGVPRKNVRELAGKPLIVWTIEQAQATPEIERVFVSTDDDEIAAIAAAAGAEVPFRRPAELAGDTVGKLPVIRHLIAEIERAGVVADRIVDLDPTSPLRDVADIRASLALLDADTDVVITGYEADKNPYFNMVEERADGSVGLVKQLPGGVVRRQDAPTVYAMNASIYVWWRRTLDRGLWDGRARLHAMPRERSVDVDAELDFRIVELLMQEKLTR